MNGAIAVPPMRIIKPSSNSVTNIGTSHHFLLCLRKDQNSEIKELRFFWASLLKSLCLCSVRLSDILILQFKTA